VNPRFHACDQFEFPGAAMELPDGKPRETYDDDECDEVESDQRRKLFPR
jgi:hypothetical protein